MLPKQEYFPKNPESVRLEKEISVLQNKILLSINQDESDRYAEQLRGLIKRRK